MEVTIKAKEYLEILRAKARIDVNGYKVLLETDEFVLAQNKSWEFATWGKDACGNGYYWGHYFSVYGETTEEMAFKSAYEDYLERVGRSV